MLPVAVARFLSGGVCDMLCTSGFVNDVMFAHNGHWTHAQVMHVVVHSDSPGGSMDLTPHRIVKLCCQEASAAHRVAPERGGV